MFQNGGCADRNISLFPDREVPNFTIVNSRCLCETVPIVEAIVRVYLPGTPSQVALFVQDNP